MYCGFHRCRHQQSPGQYAGLQVEHRCILCSIQLSTKIREDFLNVPTISDWQVMVVQPGRLKLEFQSFVAIHSRNPESCQFCYRLNHQQRLAKPKKTSGPLGPVLSHWAKNIHCHKLFVVSATEILHCSGFHHSDLTIGPCDCAMHQEQPC